MTALLESPIDAHQDGLRVGAPLAAVAVAVFADDHRWPNGTLREIVVERHRRIVQERKQVVPMTSETLEKPLRLRILPRHGQQLVQACVQSIAAGSISSQRAILPATQADRIAHQTPQFLGEFRPLGRGRLVPLDVFQVAQQVGQADLPRSAGDGVVRTPKVADQRGW